MAEGWRMVLEMSADRLREGRSPGYRFDVADAEGRIEITFEPRGLKAVLRFPAGSWSSATGFRRPASWSGRRCAGPAC